MAVDVLKLIRLLLLSLHLFQQIQLQLTLIVPLIMETQQLQHRVERPHIVIFGTTDKQMQPLLTSSQEAIQ
jgi:hypothetical protein